LVHDPNDQVVHVPAWFTLDGGDVSMEDGPQLWGYSLAREAGPGRWLIFDEGPV
jgi:hypothetical protein